MPLSYLLYSCITVLLTFGVLVRRKLRLRSIPGPFLASFTDLWRWYHQNFDNFTLVLTNLHKKYGNIVRLGPDTVSFSDATVVSSIYTMHGEFKKVQSPSRIMSYLFAKLDRRTLITLSVRLQMVRSKAASSICKTKQ